MRYDLIVDEVDRVRRLLLDACGDDLTTVPDHMARDGVGRPGRVSSVSELNQLFPAAPSDAEAIASLGEPWRDPVVEEVHRNRELLCEEGGTAAPSGKGTSSKAIANTFRTKSA